MKICVLDQASIKTGYAIFDNSDLVRWGLIDLSKEKTIENRFKTMIQKIDLLISRINPDLVIFEDVNKRNNIKTLIMLSRLQGSIMNSCCLHNKPYKIYAPSTWRKIVNITQGAKVKRAELKKQAMAFVKQSYGITVGDDIAESICIGLAYLQEHNMLTDYKIAKHKNV